MTKTSFLCLASEHCEAVICREAATEVSRGVTEGNPRNVHTPKNLEPRKWRTPFGSDNQFKINAVQICVATYETIAEVTIKYFIFLFKKKAPNCIMNVLQNIKDTEGAKCLSERNYHNFSIMFNICFSPC